ncbi:MAG TPA: hypothetical protein PKC25_13805, partial [Candidatus Rifleibacterium sp.]|nr:hypothetical protein [Candidatus Rifleibacterium sp.]
MQSLVRCMGFLVSVFLAFFALAPGSAFAQSASGTVFVVEVHKDIDKGLSFFIQRQLRRAELENAAAVILEINSNSGLVESS